MLPAINIKDIAAEAPRSRYRNTLGKVSRKAFVVAGCVGSQFAVAASDIIPSLTISERATNSVPKSSIPFLEFEIPGITTLPEYRTLVRLEKISMLEDDWDGYEAPAISKKAIERCRQAIEIFSKDIFTHLQVVPGENGGILMRYIVDNITLFCCEIGDTCMSYYVELPGEDIKDYAFIPYSKDTLKSLADCMDVVSAYIRNGR